ncbi:class E sortase [Leucobacter denitrificans]|uniref:Class E sortase n=1 Tax=Leucobacter denitrificans TaxID=683042 RepID=A0A7G9S2U0_9MICO|nr:class E sortase [Leucobacter denitrificans]QNN62165.1 class E sortase [Leucobacter denitrificans]
MEKRRRAKLSPLTVIGELLILGGLGVFGYIVWQPWHTSVAVVEKQLELTTADSAAWDEAAVHAAPYTGTVPVPEQPPIGEVFGTLHVPAFGTTFANRVAEGTGWWETLNYDDKGIGHYPTSVMPGEVGNFALAAHRSGGFITPFREIMNLRIGEPLFFETADGWYTYRFRSLEYVLPTDVGVLKPFPWIDGTPGTDQILTLTTCHPKNWGSDERAIAYAIFEEFQPRSDGPPAELIELNPAIVGGAS